VTLLLLLLLLVDGPQASVVVQRPGHLLGVGSVRGVLLRVLQ
jgi:hypothetical protein